MSTILNDITQHYQAATVGWYQYLFPVANHLFGMLAVIEIAWSGIWWAVEKQEMSSLWQEFLKRLVQIGFFYAILLHAHTWIPAIIKSFVLLGSGAAHIDKLDPSSIFSQGLSLACSVFVPLAQEDLLSAILVYVIGAVTALVIVVSFAIIAGELVVTLIESYLVLGAGVLFLGLGGSHWTSSYATSFLSYAVNVGCKLLFLYLIIGVGANMAAHWNERLVTAGVHNMQLFLEVLGGSLVFLFVAHAVPQKAVSLLSGSFQATFGGVAASSSKLQAGAKSTLSTIKATPLAMNKGMQAIKKAMGINMMNPRKK